MNNLKRLLPLGFLIAALAGSLSACNTIEGAGKDIKKAGEKIEDAANG